MGATSLSTSAHSTTSPPSIFHPESPPPGTLCLLRAAPPTQESHTNPILLNSLTTLLTTRHSIRAFLPIPVPPPLLQTALSLAQNSASNSNIQNWRLYLISGAALTTLTDALRLAASESSPKIPPLPAKYAHFRSELGAKVYGEGYAIPRSDILGKIAAERRNYTFFGAPVAGIVCMDRALAKHDAMSVGMWLQSLELGLLAQGVGCCVQVSIAGYEEVVRRELGISEDTEVLCGVAIGYEDRGERVNAVRSGRRGWWECVTEVW